MFCNSRGVYKGGEYGGKGSECAGLERTIVAPIAQRKTATLTALVDPDRR
jgi:hypothetical protein